MTDDEAVRILNQFAHRNQTDWKINHGMIQGERREDLVTPFEAHAWAQAYDEGKREKPWPPMIENAELCSAPGDPLLAYHVTASNASPGVTARHLSVEINHEPPFVCALTDGLVCHDGDSIDMTLTDIGSDGTRSEASASFSFTAAAAAPPPAQPETESEPEPAEPDGDDDEDLEEAEEDEDQEEVPEAHQKKKRGRRSSKHR